MALFPSATYVAHYVQRGLASERGSYSNSALLRRSEVNELERGCLGAMSVSAFTYMTRAPITDMSHPASSPPL